MSRDEDTQVHDRQHHDSNTAETARVDIKSDVADNTNHGGYQINGIITAKVVNFGCKDTGTEEERHYLRILYLTDPVHNKSRIENTLAGGTPPKKLYSWILEDGDFSHWQRRRGKSSGKDGEGMVRLVCITENTRQMRTLLLCGILNELRAKPPLALSEQKDRTFFFFCERYNNLANNATAVLRGLVYTLADQERSLIGCVAKYLGGADRQVLEQHNSWQILSTIFAAMMQTLGGVGGDVEGGSLIFLAVDAIDECDKDRDKLLDLISKYRGAPRIRWLLTSRRTLDIGRGFEPAAEDKVGPRCGLEVDANSCPQEVHRLLSSMETARYQRAVQSLLNMSPKQRDFYRRALSTAIMTYRPLHIQEWCVLCSMKPCGDKCDMKSCNDECEVKDAREKCEAFLVVDEDDTVRITSESARNFLQKRQGTPLFTDPRSQAEHYRIFTRCLEIMSKTLRRNMFGLEDPGSEIEPTASEQNSPQTIDGVFVGEQAYACEYWVGHLLESGQRVGDSVTTFLERKLLCWIEHVCVMGSIERTIGLWAQLARFLQNNQPTDAITQLAIEVHRFMVRNEECISEYPLQIYQSALVFFQPSHGILQRVFKKHRPRWVTLSTPGSDYGQQQQPQTLSHSQGCEVDKLVFSSDGTWIAAVMDGLKIIKVWDLVAGGRLLWDLNHRSRVRWVAFHPWKRRLMATADGATVRLWDVKLKKQVMPTPTGPAAPNASTGAFSPDGQLLALASEQQRGSGICVWGWGTGKEPTVFQQPGGDRGRCYLEPAHSLALSADGTKVISAHSDCMIRLWDVASHVCVRTILSGHVHSIATPAPPAPPAQGVSVGSAVWVSDDEITRWDLHADEVISRLSLPREDETGFDLSRMLALAPHGDSFTMATSDQAETWNIVDGRMHRHSLMNLGSSIHALAFSGNSTKVAIACFTGIFLWDLRGHARDSRVMLDHAGPVDLLRGSSGGGDETPKLLVSTSMSTGDIKVRHLNSSKNEGKWLQQHDASKSATGKVIDVTISADGTRLLCISDNRPAAVWNLQTFQQDHVIPGRGLSLAAEWLPPPKGDWVAVLLLTGAIKLWDVKKRGQVRLYPRRSGAGLIEGTNGGCIAVAPNGKHMATSFRNMIELWNPDAPSVKCVRHWGDQDTASALRFAEPRAHDRKDVNQLAALYLRGDIKIWDVEDGTCLWTMTSTKAGATELIAFSPGLCGVMTNVGPVADTSACRSYEVDMDAGWIMKGSERVLWLPPDCRPRSALVVPDKAGAVSTIILGCWTGRVLVLDMSA